MVNEVVASPNRERVPLPPGDFIEKPGVATTTGQGPRFARAASMNRRRAAVARARAQSSATTRKNHAHVSMTQSRVRQGGVRIHPLPTRARAQRRRERAVMWCDNMRERSRSHLTTPPLTPNLAILEVNRGCIYHTPADQCRWAAPDIYLYAKLAEPIQNI